MPLDREVRFHKMHGLGNDFVICDYRGLDDLILRKERIQELADRKFGIGFDLLVTMHEDDDADVYIRMYNADGSIAGACGNVTRCVAYLLCQDLGTDEVQIKTDSDILNCQKLDDTSFSVNLGRPKVSWQEIPLSMKFDSANIDVGDEKLGLGFAVNVGNPHIVFFVSHLDEVDLERDVARYETHDFFPERINVNIVEVDNNDAIKLKTWERGVGATLACGTGASASFYAAYQKGLVGDKVNVTMPGGVLEISLNENGEIVMVGDVTYVFAGKVDA
jgi:diaminopimelate epimerase